MQFCAQQSEILDLPVYMGDLRIQQLARVMARRTASVAHCQNGLQLREGKNQSPMPVESLPLSAEMSEHTHGNFLLYATAEAKVRDARRGAACRCLRR